MHLVPTDINAAVFHEGSASAADKFYRGIGANMETIKTLAKEEAEKAGRMNTVVRRAVIKIKAGRIAKGILPFVGRNVLRAIPIATTGLALLEFSDNVKAHGIGGAVARATPVLGDLIAAHDLGSDLAKQIMDEADAHAGAHLNQLNAHVLPSWEKANEQTIDAFRELAPQIHVTNQPHYDDGSLVDPREIARELDTYRDAMRVANMLHAKQVKGSNFDETARRNKQRLKEGLERASQKRAAPVREPFA